MVSINCLVIQIMKMKKDCKIKPKNMSTRERNQKNIHRANNAKKDRKKSLF